MPTSPEMLALFSQLRTALKDVTDHLEKHVDLKTVISQPYEHELSAYDRARSLLNRLSALEKKSPPKDKGTEPSDVRVSLEQVRKMSASLRVPEGLLIENLHLLGLPKPEPELPSEQISRVTQSILELLIKERPDLLNPNTSTGSSLLRFDQDKELVRLAVGKTVGEIYLWLCEYLGVSSLLHRGRRMIMLQDLLPIFGFTKEEISNLDKN
jgi:hypothetical protein